MESQKLYLIVHLVSPPLLSKPVTSSQRSLPTILSGRTLPEAAAAASLRAAHSRMLGAMPVLRKETDTHEVGNPRDNKPGRSLRAKEEAPDPMPTSEQDSHFWSVLLHWVIHTEAEL